MWGNETPRCEVSAASAHRGRCRRGCLLLGPAAAALAFALGFGLGRFAAIGQLDDRHRRGIAVAVPELDDARVAAGALLEARRDVVEQLA